MVIRSSIDEIDKVVSLLHDKVALKDMGRLNFSLGIEVQHTAQGLCLTQKKYVEEILNKTGMSGASSTPTRLVRTPKFTASNGSSLYEDIHLYCSIVGKLQYLCVTRPDLAFSVNKLSQYMNAPSEDH